MEQERYSNLSYGRHKFSGAHAHNIAIFATVFAHKLGYFFNRLRTHRGRSCRLHPSSFSPPAPHPVPKILGLTSVYKSLQKSQKSIPAAHFTIRQYSLDSKLLILSLRVQVPQAESGIGSTRCPVMLQFLSSSLGRVSW